MRNIGGVILAAAVWACAAGCSQVNTTHADRYEEGLVVCLSGAGGMMGETDRLREGLVSGGVNSAIETFEWSRGGVLADQTGVDYNHRKARELSRRIEGYRKSHPGRPVHLIGVSAGTGLVVWALEDLDESDAVTGAVLISSSLDTRYDLTKALARVTDHLYSFNSVADTILSLGVTWTGTVDRGGGLAGGLVGFSPPDKASDETKALYKNKLIEISWWPGDMILGHLGDHLGATSPSYVKAKIAPIVLGRQPAKTAPPKGAPTEAVKAGQPATKAYAERLEAKRKADEAAKKAEAKKAAAKKDDVAPKTGNATQPASPDQASPPPTGRSEKPVRSKDSRGRFFNWRVGQGVTATQTTRSADEDQFFTKLRRLP